MSFETDRIDDCIKFMQSLKDKQQALNGSRPGELCVMATGGGAFKYYDKIRQALGVDVLREDEMECLIIGKSKSFIFAIRSEFRSKPPSRTKPANTTQASTSSSPKSPAKYSPTLKPTQWPSPSLQSTSTPTSWSTSAPASP